MRQRTRVMLRMFAVVAVLGFAFAGMMVSPASAQETIFDGPCQITEPGETPIQDNCQVVFDEANDTCTVTFGDETFQDVEGCADIVQGECPFQFIDGTRIVQIICEGDEVTPTTPVATTPGATTPVATTPVATTPGATTPVATTPGATTPVATTPVATTPVATDVPDDDDDVDELPDTGQGPVDSGDNGTMVLVFGAMSMLTAVAAFAWQRRSVA